MCSAASARANDPDAPGVAFEARATRGSRSVAIASTPSSFSGWRSPPAAVARTCSVAVPGSVMRTVNVDGRRAGRERDRLLGLVDHDVRIAGAVEADARLGGAIGEQADVDPERACARGRRRARSAPTTATSPRSSDGSASAYSGVPRSRRRSAVATRSPRVGTPSEISSRRGIAVASTRPAPKPTASARSVAAPAGGGRRAIAGAAGRGADLLGARGEADHARRRIAALGGGAGQRGDGLVRERQRAVGDAVGDVDQRHRRDGARGAAQRRAGQRDGDAREHQRPQQRLQRAAGRREKSASDRRAISQSSGAASSASSHARVLERQRLSVRPKQRAHVVHRRW